MKRTVFVALAILGILAFSVGTAFAQGYYTGAGSSYLGATVNPHGGFTTTTGNCGVCHSVHHAEEGGEALMRGTIAGACTYCHISTTTGYVQIYDYTGAGDSDANYVGPSDYAHDTNNGVLGGGVSGVMCTNCHQVHAASTQMVTANAHLVTKILKSGTFQATNMPAIAAGDADGVAVSKWCTRCHPYYNEGYDGTTHTMRAPTANYAASRVTEGVNVSAVAAPVAWASSRECHGCHNRGVTDQVEVAGIGVATYVQYSFPHYTDGKRFLSTDDAALQGGANDAVTGAQSTASDGVCINCHRDGAGNGVGATW